MTKFSCMSTPKHKIVTKCFCRQLLSTISLQTKLIYYFRARVCARLCMCMPFYFQVHDFYMCIHTHTDTHTWSNITHRMQWWSQKLCHNITTYAHRPYAYVDVKRGMPWSRTCAASTWSIQILLFVSFIFVDCVKEERERERMQNKRQKEYDHTLKHNIETLVCLCLSVCVHTKVREEREIERESLYVWECFRSRTTQYQHSLPPITKSSMYMPLKNTHIQAHIDNWSLL